MSKSSRSRAPSPAAALVAASPDRLPIAIALCDLAVAPENLRFDETADDGIPQLAETIFAAGLLQPLTVRPGGADEKPAMVLDGRRRWFALMSLLATERIGEDYPVSCFVEADPARQAAAVVLTNTAVPVHPADVIVAIGRMLQARLTVSAIAAALGYAELDVRRLAALAQLHPKALDALRAGRCTLRQAKLLARLPDRTAQGDIAEAALNGFGFQEWKVNERLEQGQVTVHDRRFGLVGAQRYAEAGGRLESDLFGERAAAVLDPDRLQAAWTARAERFAQALAEAHACKVVISVNETDFDDSSLEPVGDNYGMALETEQAEAWRAANAVVRTARTALEGRDLADPAADTDIAAFLVALVAAYAASEPGRPVTLAAIFADPSTGLDARVWGPPQTAEDEGPAEAEEPGCEQANARAAEALRPSSASPEPLATPPAVDVDGVNHRLHELRSDVATRALVRALADDPAAALTAVVARLFAVIVLQRGVGKSEGALSLTADAYGRLRTSPIASLDGEVRRRLAERRDAWAASGLSTIAWVAGMDQETQLVLLAELAGLSLDLREERTTSLRRAARAEAVEIAALCRADASQHWSPDAAFLMAHSKTKLLGMLAEMGVSEPLAAGAQKDELVALVAVRAAERRWAPAYVSWRSEPPAIAEVEGPPDADEPTSAKAGGNEDEGSSLGPSPTD